jgi:hypothetical protein
MPRDSLDKRGAAVTLDQVEQFLSARKPVAAANRKLIFSIDATASRSATWTAAQELQGEMLRDNAGALSLQLVFYRGEECKASTWTSDANRLATSMSKIECLSGETQIKKIFRHALREYETVGPVQALVFIGDAVEESEDELVGLAGELGRHKLPVFVFQEGRDADVERIFKLIAERSGGKYFHFDPSNIEKLAEKLAAVATFAVTGDASVLAIAANKG